MGMESAVKVVRVSLAVVSLLPLLVLAEPPPNPLPTFDSAKRVARDGIYSDQRTDFYCACAFAPAKTASGGRIDPAECGYTPRKNMARGKVLEWEHVMPAHFFGHTRACWTKGHSKCVKADGKAFKGRSCCAKVDQVFKRIEADLHNLAPSVGELNGDRSNLPYGLVTSDALEYGKCKFKIGGKPRVCEPRAEVKGDAARIWFYMAETYKVRVTAAQRVMFEEWSASDPVDAFERLRNERVFAAQGNRNPFVK